MVWPEGLFEQQGSCGRKSWSVDGRQGAREAWRPIRMARWLDWSMKEIGCRGKYVDNLDSSHSETTEDIESHYLSSTSSLLTSITKWSFCIECKCYFILSFLPSLWLFSIEERNKNGGFILKVLLYCISSRRMWVSLCHSLNTKSVRSPSVSALITSQYTIISCWSKC